MALVIMNVALSASADMANAAATLGKQDLKR
jgi:hypothetical protein